jgi:hypothetical protein
LGYSVKELHAKSIWIGESHNGHCLNEGGMIRILCDMNSWNNEFFNVKIKFYDILLYLGYYNSLGSHDLLLLHTEHGLIHLWSDEIKHTITVL